MLTVLVRDFPAATDPLAGERLTEKSVGNAWIVTVSVVDVDPLRVPLPP
jgi:hypothetical protein